MEKEYSEDKIREIDIEIEMMRREVDNLKRERLREQREREEMKKRITVLEKEGAKERRERDEEIEGEKGSQEENEELKKKVASLVEENKLLKEKLRKLEKIEDGRGENERKEAESIEKIAERFIDKEKTLLVRKGRLNRKEKIETWMKRHAGEVEFKVAKLWTTEAARWLIFKDKVDRDSLMLKERKVNAEEIYTIEEVKEGRERWSSRKVGSQMERLERIKNGGEEYESISKEGKDQRKEDGLKENLEKKVEDKEKEASEEEEEKEKIKKLIKDTTPEDKKDKEQGGTEEANAEQELGEK